MGECCLGLACVGAVCITPPSATGYAPENFERVYKFDCPIGAKGVWRFFDWKAVTPDSNSMLEFYAETQADPSAFATLPPWPLPIQVGDAVLLGSAKGPTRSRFPVESSSACASRARW